MNDIQEKKRIAKFGEYNPLSKSLDEKHPQPVFLSTKSENFYGYRNIRQHEEDPLQSQVQTWPYHCWRTHIESKWVENLDFEIKLNSMDWTPQITRQRLSRKTTVEMESRPSHQATLLWWKKRCHKSCRTKTYNYGTQRREARFHKSSQLPKKKMNVFYNKNQDWSFIYALFLVLRIYRFDSTLIDQKHM